MAVIIWQVSQKLNVCQIFVVSEASDFVFYVKIIKMLVQLGS